MANFSAAPELADVPYALAANALLIANALRADVGEALAAAGIRVQARVDPSIPLPADLPGIDLVLLDAHELTEVPLAALIDTLAGPQFDASVARIAIFSREQIDLAAPLLGKAHLLCEPGRVELLGALLQARTGGEGEPWIHVSDVTRDSEIVRLRRLNEEVARIADALARLTRGELAEDIQIERSGLRESEMAYRGPEDSPPEIAATEVRSTIRARRLRGQFFAPELFADPAWDMLLDLFAAGLERRRVSVSSLCIAAAVPPTTALRWIGTMHEAGLFDREADPGDRRRAYIVLSDKAQRGMRAYVGALRRAGLALV